MDIARVMEIYESYTSKSVSDIMHPDERMVAKNYSVYEFIAGQLYVGNINVAYKKLRDSVSEEWKVLVNSSASYT